MVFYLLFKFLPCYIMICDSICMRCVDTNCHERFPLTYEGKENVSYLIGGLFPVHYYNHKEGKYIINPPGIAWIEAMLLAIEEINNSTDILPNVTLGYKIYDSCNMVNRTLESALQVIEGYYRYEKNYNSSCRAYFKRAVALIGSASSNTNYKLAAIMAASKTPHISYSSSSTDLTAGHLYPSFMRTIPPDNYQAHVIASLLQRFNWTYVNIVAMDDKYGRVGVMNLLRELKRHNICVCIKEIYDMRSDKERTTSLILRLKAEKEATVIVLWCERFDALDVLREAERLQLYHRTWVGSEAFGNSHELFTIHHKVIQGMFGIIPYQKDYDPFIVKLKSITPNNSDTRNPWLDEYWRKQRKCRELAFDAKHHRCEEEDVNLSALPINKHISVINAVYAVAYGLQKYMDQEMVNSSVTVKPSKLLQYVKGINFIGKDGTRVSFDKDGNPTEASYLITNLHFNATITRFSFVRVGKWRRKDIVSRSINMTNVVMNITKGIQFSNFSTEAPRSSCAGLCKPGHKGVKFGDLPCCWKCVPCPLKQIQPNPFQFNCTECKGDLVTNLNQTRCIRPIVKRLCLDSLRGVLLLVIVVICYFALISSVVVFCRNKNTAIMNASNRELSWIQLISFLFLLAFPLSSFTSTVTILICELQHYYFLCFYTIVMSITFTKADRLLRVFNAGKIGILRCRERSNRFQLIIVGVLTVFGQLLLAFVHYTLPLTVESHYPTISDDVVHVTYYCNDNYDIHLFIAIAYIQVIALICGVYAFKARGLPETFNEARYTSFAMFSFILAWMMFVPIYFSTRSYFERSIRWSYMSLAVTIKLYVLMYMKKLYIIQFRPELNTKEHVAGEIKAFNLALARKGDDSQ